MNRLWNLYWKFVFTLLFLSIPSSWFFPEFADFLGIILLAIFAIPFGLIMLIAVFGYIWMRIDF